MLIKALTNLTSVINIFTTLMDHDTQTGITLNRLVPTFCCYNHKTKCGIHTMILVLKKPMASATAQLFVPRLTFVSRTQIVPWWTAETVSPWNRMRSTTNAEVPESTEQIQWLSQCVPNMTWIFYKRNLKAQICHLDTKMIQ